MVSEEKLNNLSQWEAGTAILFIQLARKTQNYVEDDEILLPLNFPWIPFSGFRAEVYNVSANERPGRTFCFSIGQKKQTNLVENVEILLSVKFR